jgi:NAD(P)-dependent dehydrogenase (short-subunit alcohol dehydrogenase family)
MNIPAFEPISRTAGAATCPHSAGTERTAGEIAGVVAFLASKDASFITGVNLPVDASASSGQAAFI